MSSQSKNAFFPCLAVLLSLLVIPVDQAKSNNFDAELLKATGYFDGSGRVRPEDKMRARNLLLPAAESGDPIAQFFISRTFEESCFGRDSFCDYEYWLRMAANNGEPTSQVLLGLHLQGQEIEINPEAIYWMTAATKAGDPNGKKQAERIIGEAILNAEGEEQKSAACSSFHSNRVIFGENALTLFASNLCNLISNEQLIKMLFEESRNGNAIASTLLAATYEGFGIFELAEKYYRLAYDQVPTNTDNSYLASRLVDGTIDLLDLAANSSSLRVDKYRLSMEERISSLVANASSIDEQVSHSMEQLESDRQEKNPLGGLFRKIAGVTLYALAIGLEGAAQGMADYYSEPRHYSLERKSLGPGLPTPNQQIKQTAGSSSYFMSSSQPFSPSCRCACVDGRSVSLCTSITAVPAICTEVCPVSVPTYQLPNVSVPPPGTSRCFNRSVYSRVNNRYETKSVCE